MSQASITVRHPSEFGRLFQNSSTLDCHFAFRDYADLAPTHWGRLRVLNRVTLAPHAVFALGHESSVEIMTFVLEGSVIAQVAGQDNSTLMAEDCHIISAGTGVVSATWTAEDVPTALMQFWLLPEEEGGEPETGLRREDHHNASTLIILASGFPEDDPEDKDEGKSGNPLPLKTCARLMRLTLLADADAAISTYPSRSIYILVIEGEVEILGEKAGSGCGVALTGYDMLTIRAFQPSKLIICDSD